MLVHLTISATTSLSSTIVGHFYANEFWMKIHKLGFHLAVCSLKSAMLFVSHSLYTETRQKNLSAATRFEASRDRSFKNRGREWSDLGLKLNIKIYSYLRIHID